MPELPDIVVYIEALEKRVVGQMLQKLRVGTPFLVRTFDPPISAIDGKTVITMRRIGKRIVFGFEDDLWLVLHLMIAGRLHWKSSAAHPAPGGKPIGSKAAGKGPLAAFEFPNGTLTLTEAGTKRRASLHLVLGEESLLALDPGGLEVMDASLDDFTSALTSSNHTLKRALTDPRLFSGIGNAYSDEILFEAQMSPAKLTQRMTPDEIARLYIVVQLVLATWVDRMRAETGDGFPEKVTAFRAEMTVHGKYGEPCVRCGSSIQRIQYADNETDYCARCQTGGKLLSDRALARLLREDWPKTLDELELLMAKNRAK